jgi:hypothetical protein
LVEQLIRNQQVIGSSPIVGSSTIRAFTFLEKFSLLGSRTYPRSQPPLVFGTAGSTTQRMGHPAVFFLPCTQSKNTQVLRFDIRAPSLVPLIH